MLRSHLFSRSHCLFGLLGLSLIAAFAVPSRADFPKPSPFPLQGVWELKMDLAKPARIVVKGAGDITPKAYWYIVFHVVNKSNTDRVPFYPSFEMVMEDGTIIPSDRNVPAGVFDEIKKVSHKKFLLNLPQARGDLRQGEDQSRDSVAIWPEPALRMGTFNVFVSGFSGETKPVKIGDKDIILHKTQQLTYHLNSDEHHPGEGDLSQIASTYVMR